MVRELLDLVADRVRPVKYPFGDPRTGGDTPDGSARYPNNSVAFRTAQYKERRQRHGDHGELHGFDTKIKTKQADQAIPAGDTKLIQRRCEREPVNEPDIAAMIASRPGISGRIE